jgi:transposase
LRCSYERLGTAPVWPIQCTRALRGLIHAANLVRAAGHPEIDPAVRDDLIREFHQAVVVGHKDVPHVGRPRDKQPHARNLLEDLYHRHDDVTRFCYDTTIPPTNNLAERDLRPNKTQQKSPAGSPAIPPPPTGWPSAVTYPPRSNTASTP